ncbi:glycosyltransferase family 2 protein [Amorphus coralli]|uniref:glycosyltransferase family 2 protein n=1 Tax=Amorphus coralli TaxID=340680 RepID=UPI00036F9902|nr:glycosyltransferase family 2 protein [Amorphus coralli]
MKSICIISPVFREELTIGVFHQALLDAIAPLEEHYRFQFIYVMDPSTDRTEDALRALTAGDSRVTSLVMSRRFGHQPALIAGIDECGDADAAIMMDSDMQHPPILIPEMLARWEAGADIVQTLRQDGAETGTSKRVTSRWFYSLLGRISHVKLQPGAADYRLLSRPVIEVFRNELREQNAFLRGLVGWVGFTVAYLPFTPAQRHAGQSSYSVSRLISFALNGFCSFSKFPLRLCVVSGLVLAGVSFLAGIVLTMLYLFGARVVPGWASLFSFMSFATGLNMLFLGIIGEYIALIFDEVKDRPRYIVARRYDGPSPSDSAG